MIAHPRIMLSKYHLKLHFCLLSKTNSDPSFTCIYTAHSHSTRMKTFCIPLCKGNISYSFIQLSKGYIWPIAKVFCIFNSKRATPCSKHKLQALWTVDTHARLKGNWVLLIDGNVEPFLIWISVLVFSILTQEFCLQKWLEAIAFKPACVSENLTYTFQMVFWAMLAWATSPTWPLIKRSWISMLTVLLSFLCLFVFDSVLLESQKVYSCFVISFYWVDFSRQFIWNSLISQYCWCIFCVCKQCLIWVVFIRYIYK